MFTLELWKCYDPLQCGLIVLYSRHTYGTWRWCPFYDYFGISLVCPVSWIPCLLSWVPPHCVEHKQHLGLNCLKPTMSENIFFSPFHLIDSWPGIEFSVGQFFFRILKYFLHRLLAFNVAYKLETIYFHLLCIFSFPCIMCFLQVLFFCLFWTLTSMFLLILKYTGLKTAKTLWELEWGLLIVHFSVRWALGGVSLGNFQSQRSFPSGCAESSGRPFLSSAWRFKWGLASTRLEPEKRKRGRIGDGFTIQMHIYLNPPFSRILLPLKVPGFPRIETLSRG